MDNLSDKLLIYSPAVAFVICLLLCYIFTKSRNIKFLPNVFSLMLSLIFFSVLMTVVVIGVFTFVPAIAQKAQGVLAAVFVGPSIGQLIGFVVWRKMNTQ